jgi:hypothetical protein
VAGGFICRSALVCCCAHFVFGLAKPPVGGLMDLQMLSVQLGLLLSICAIGGYVVRVSSSLQQTRQKSFERMAELDQINQEQSLRIRSLEARLLKVEEYSLELGNKAYIVHLFLAKTLCFPDGQCETHKRMN